ncbi:MAG TPA: hypothetical protein VH858_14810 [Hyphomicrobiales bacterium]|jgi:hypothetical protein
MIETLFLPYLLLLLLLPSLAWWRWGLPAALLATVAGLILVALVFYLMAAYNLFPKIEPGRPFQNPEEQSAWQQAASGLLVYGYLFLPAAVALCGGVLAAAMAIFRGIWRGASVMRRRGGTSADGPAG